MKIKVNELPPKKDGANSMWNKEVEVDRLIKLRKEHHFKRFSPKTPHRLVVRRELFILFG